MSEIAKLKLTGGIVVLIGFAFLLNELGESGVGNAIVANFAGEPTSLVTSDKSYVFKNSRYGNQVYAYHAEPVRGVIIYALEPIDQGLQVNCTIYKKRCYAIPYSPYDYVSSYKRSSINSFLMLILAGVALAAFANKLSLMNQKYADQGH